ncbi:unnamed protein product [Amoebophrya sp. A120]|nr:unnamed protein product [Amoebophrya sp. A120]|eukprot:GSA120T00004358001.1
MARVSAKVVPDSNWGPPVPAIDKTTNEPPASSMSKKYYCLSNNVDNTTTVFFATRPLLRHDHDKGTAKTTTKRRPSYFSKMHKNQHTNALTNASTTGSGPSTSSSSASWSGAKGGRAAASFLAANARGKVLVCAKAGAFSAMNRDQAKVRRISETTTSNGTRLGAIMAAQKKISAGGGVRRSPVPKNVARTSTTRRGAGQGDVNSNRRINTAITTPPQPVAHPVVTTKSSSKRVILIASSPDDSMQELEVSTSAYQDNEALQRTHLHYSAFYKRHSVDQQLHEMQEEQGEQVTSFDEHAPHEFEATEEETAAAAAQDGEKDGTKNVETEWQRAEASTGAWTSSLAEDTDLVSKTTTCVGAPTTSLSSRSHHPRESAPPRTLSNDIEVVDKTQLVSMAAPGNDPRPVDVRAAADGAAVDAEAEIQQRVREDSKRNEPFSPATRSTTTSTTKVQLLNTGAVNLIRNVCCPPDTTISAGVSDLESERISSKASSVEAMLRSGANLLELQPPKVAWAAAGARAADSHQYEAEVDQPRTSAVTPAGRVDELPVPNQSPTAFDAVNISSPRSCASTSKPESSPVERGDGAASGVVGSDFQKANAKLVVQAALPDSVVSTHARYAQSPGSPKDVKDLFSELLQSKVSSPSSVLRKKGVFLADVMLARAQQKNQLLTVPHEGRRPAAGATSRTTSSPTRTGHKTGPLSTSGNTVALTVSNEFSSSTASTTSPGPRRGGTGAKKKVIRPDRWWSDLQQVESGPLRVGLRQEEWSNLRKQRRQALEEDLVSDQCTPSDDVLLLKEKTQKHYRHVSPRLHDPHWNYTRRNLVRQVHSSCPPPGASTSSRSGSPSPSPNGNAAGPRAEDHHTLHTTAAAALQMKRKKQLLEMRIQNGTCLYARGKAAMDQKEFRRCNWLAERALAETNGCTFRPDVFVDHVRERQKANQRLLEKAERRWADTATVSPMLPLENKRSGNSASVSGAASTPPSSRIQQSSRPGRTKEDFNFSPEPRSTGVTSLSTASLKIKSVSQQEQKIHPGSTSLRVGGVAGAAGPPKTHQHTAGSPAPGATQARVQKMKIDSPRVQFVSAVSSPRGNAMSSTATLTSGQIASSSSLTTTVTSAPAWSSAASASSATVFKTRDSSASRRVATPRGDHARKIYHDQLVAISGEGVGGRGGSRVKDKESGTHEVLDNRAPPARGNSTASHTTTSVVTSTTSNKAYACRINLATPSSPPPSSSPRTALRRPEFVAKSSTESTSAAPAGDEEIPMPLSSASPSLAFFSAKSSRTLDSIATVSLSTKNLSTISKNKAERESASSTKTANKKPPGVGGASASSLAAPRKLVGAKEQDVEQRSKTAEELGPSAAFEEHERQRAKPKSLEKTKKETKNPEDLSPVKLLHQIKEVLLGKNPTAKRMRPLDQVPIPVRGGKSPSARQLQKSRSVASSSFTPRRAGSQPASPSVRPQRELSTDQLNVPRFATPIQRTPRRPRNVASKTSAAAAGVVLDGRGGASVSDRQHKQNINTRSQQGTGTPKTSGRACSPFRCASAPGSARKTRDRTLEHMLEIFSSPWQKVQAGRRYNGEQASTRPADTARSYRQLAAGPAPPSEKTIPSSGGRSRSPFLAPNLPKPKIAAEAAMHVRPQAPAALQPSVSYFPTADTIDIADSTATGAKSVEQHFLLTPEWEQQQQHLLSWLAAESTAEFLYSNRSGAEVHLNAVPPLQHPPTVFGNTSTTRGGGHSNDQEEQVLVHHPPPPVTISGAATANNTSLSIDEIEERISSRRSSMQIVEENEEDNQVD